MSFEQPRDRSLLAQYQINVAILGLPNDDAAVNRQCCVAKPRRYSNPALDSAIQVLTSSCRAR